MVISFFPLQKQQYLRKEPDLKADFNVERAILCIRIKFVALFLKKKQFQHEINNN